MAMMTVRNIPDEVYRALRVRAAKHGHSAEAEILNNDGETALDTLSDFSEIPPLYELTVRYASEF